MKPMKPKDFAKLSPERVRIAKIFQTHIDKAVEELDVGCEMTVQGRFDTRYTYRDATEDSKKE